LASALLLLAGCGGAPAPVAPSTPSTSAPNEGEDAPAAKAPGDLMDVQGIDLLVHASEATAGQAQAPLFKVHAASVSMKENGVYDFEQGRATVYGRERREDDIVFDAQRGRYEEDKGARLEGDVVGRVGPMTLKLADVTWEKTEAEPRGILYTNQSLRVENPTMELIAESMRIYPETKVFVLDGMSGLIDFMKRSSP